MLDFIIKTSLRYRAITIVAALALLVYGAVVMRQLPIDVFPDLNRPRVTIMTEAHGLAPEEVEQLISFPLEAALNGATGVQAVRSQSQIGLSIVQVEFDWGMNIYIARQVVAEKVALAASRMPQEANPVLAPISSLMGQVIHIGVYSETGETDPMAIRTYADWVIRQRLLTVPGVAQVTAAGGGRKQYQVLVDAEQLLKYEITLGDVEKAVRASNTNATGGFVESGSQELMVRSLGRITSIDDLQNVVIKPAEDRPVLLNQVARIVERPQYKRGEASISGRPGVLMVITKQPGADTRQLTTDVMAALDDLQASLPADVKINREIYQQKEFIDRSIDNVIEALRDGGILVVIVLFLFLLNFRTTFITLTAIPLSLVATALVFKAMGMSINTMTLGGLAVAIGELVDDAIVDVENIFRRLRENRAAGSPKHPLRVVYEASSEVRNSIVFSTILVVLVFVPLFALNGMEGRLFTPLGVAYIVSIIASLVVSLTVTPVLSYWLLPNAPATEHEKEGILLRFLQWIAGHVIRFSLAFPWQILTAVTLAVGLAGVVAWNMGKDFLPPFNEGTAQLNVVLPPGISLRESNRIGHMVDERIAAVPGVLHFGRRTGRAELDEHADGVNVSETIISFDPKSGRTREEIVEEIRGEVSKVAGVVSAVEQPMQHMISEMLSGVKAKIGIKLYGDDLHKLRRIADQMKAAIADVPGLADLRVEQQSEVPQLQIKVRREKLAQLGLTVDDVNHFIETAMNGQTVSEVYQSERKFDLVVRLDDDFRNDVEKLKRLSINLPTGGKTSLQTVAEIALGSGPNTVNRENVRRRIIVQCNVKEGVSLSDALEGIQAKLDPMRKTLPTGYFFVYSGQFESQQEATRMILLLGLLSLGGMFFALFSLFHSVNLSLQVLTALPMAAIGAVAALVITGQSLSVASMVGFISLSGIASRNGILLIAHYLHLVRYEGEAFTPQMIERAGKERLAPMLMTALTAGIALIPLVMAAGEPGKEILHPVATVILGGLISSTLLDFFVHPALFWLFGRAQAEQHLHDSDVDPLEEPKTPVVVTDVGWVASQPEPTNGHAPTVPAEPTLAGGS